MKKIAALTSLVAGAVLLAGCSASSITQDELASSRFVLVEANGVTLTQEVLPYIQFSETLDVNGKMCNSFRGKVTLEDGVLSSQGLASTRMMCADEQLNALDVTINQVLTQGAKTTFENNRLTLTTPTQTLVYQQDVELVK